MSSNTFKRLKSMLIKSAAVQLEIEKESRRRYPDWIRVITLKKQRLLIKDALLKLRQQARRRPNDWSYMN